MSHLVPEILYEELAEIFGYKRRMSRLEEIEARANAATQVYGGEHVLSWRHGVCVGDSDDIPWLLAEVKWLREKWADEVGVAHLVNYCMHPIPACGCPDVMNNPPTHDTPEPA